MTCAKLLLIVTNTNVRRRLLATWREFVIEQPGVDREGSPPTAAGAEAPVAFTRLKVRDDLSLSVFVVDGGWRREYVCHALARQVDGYCLVVGSEASELILARDLMQLLGRTTPGMIASAVAGGEPRVRSALALPEETPIPSVDCADRISVAELVCALLEHLAAARAA